MNDAPTAEPLLDVRDVHVHFRTTRFGRARVVKAVRGIDLQVAAGQTVALVGESGSGKSTLARAITRIVPTEQGTIQLGGVALHELKGSALRAQRHRVQMVFQDPYSSLNPSMTVGASVAEPLGNFTDAKGADLDRTVADLFEKVGLPAAHRHRYPHEFSGGQRQRIAVARAISANPSLIICDEAVSALDVSTQNQILQLLEDLQSDLGVAYLFVTHDLSVVWHIAHEVAVMYLGELVEFGPSDTVLAEPAHPYTRSLTDVVPVPDPRAQRARQRRAPVGEVPDPANPPSGCGFHTRCPEVMDVCREVSPEWRALDDAGWRVRCHLYDPTEPVPVAIAGSATDPE
jgi:oligopeptide/dipeptide ABC transporter ATP-binding protein